MAALAANILSLLANFRKFVFGPRLIRIYPIQRRSSGRDYEPNSLEFFCDFFIKSVSYTIYFSLYASPLLAFYIFKKGLLTTNQVMYVSKVFATLGMSITIMYIMRGFGRSGNADYKRFVEILNEARRDPNKKMLLQAYDIEFFAWPVDFKWNESDINPLIYNLSPEKKYANTFFQEVLDVPMKVVAYVIAHGFARPLTYPGSVKLLQNAFAEPLKNGRAFLMEKNGLRAKLQTEDGNEIDTMFLDRRNFEDNGRTLVITCEGNAGFYEIGCMASPRQAGYSVLGWNHPGFAGSSGLPNPQSERKAMDVVIKYAVTKLGFQLEDIVLFAWSIGGFTASYGAMAYPQIKGVVLDATFDDVLPLAMIKMPQFISNIVTRVVRNYFNLNVEQQLVRYPGPIRLIRRFREEIITTEPYVPATNRANFLLIGILKHRYPSIMTDESINAVMEFLAAQDFQAQGFVKEKYGVDVQSCEEAIKISTQGTRLTFPCELGKDWDPNFRTNMAIFLVTKYMDHFDATHCIPLPTTYFQLPWQE